MQMGTQAMNVEQAVARSISHTEIVKCEFAGDYAQLLAFVSDTFANGNDAIFSEELDGTIDVADIDGDWRINVTLAKVAIGIDHTGEWTAAQFVIDMQYSLDDVQTIAELGSMDAAEEAAELTMEQRAEVVAYCKDRVS
jgi:hypothetical protein